jgi:hypothetical protein
VRVESIGWGDIEMFQVFKKDENLNSKPETLNSKQENVSALHKNERPRSSGLSDTERSHT